ncbi:MAG: helix-turn-helix domain-containing protein [Odoribacter sp.]|nr:helix-turn-helix domain-containing protein [Odoribacter sp.]
MKILALEEKIFLKLKEELHSLSKEVNNLKMAPKETLWMDNQEVYNLLEISKRTLQTYWDKGILPFSQIGYKCYYKKEDVQKLIDNSIKL